MSNSEIDKLLRNLKKQNGSHRRGIDAQTYLNQLKGEPNDMEQLDATLRQINSEIERDFGVKLGDMDLNQQADFEVIEKAVNEKVIGQNEFVHDLITAFKRPFVTGVEKKQSANNLIVAGGKGTGKRSALQVVASEMHKQKLIPVSRIKEIQCSLYTKSEDEKLLLQDLYGALSSQSSIIVFSNIDQLNQGFMTYLVQLASSGKLQLSKRYASQNNQLVEASNSLLNETVSTLSAENKYLVFLSDSHPDKLSHLFGTTFIRSIRDVAQTKSFTFKVVEQLAKIQIGQFVEKCLKRLNYVISAEDSFVDYVVSNYQKDEGVYSLIGVCNDCFDALSAHKLEMNSNITATLAYDEKVLLKIGNVTQYLMDFMNSPLEEEGIRVKEELDAIVGLQKVKEYVLSLENNVKIQRLRQAQGLKSADVTMHMIFMGNPGTGKTTIARIVAKYLKAMQVINGGQLVEVTRADLVGKYVGHTAPLTNQVIESALGGVLFIDEAYSLYRGKDDSFGLEAIDTIVKGMEDHRDDLIVILAGYTREMTEFLEANSGLKSRFPNKIEFEDYTAEELLQISKSVAKGKDYYLHESCDEPLKAYYDKKQKEDARGNGNGRMARNCIEDAILRQAKRILNNPNQKLDELLPEDFNLSN